MAALQADLQRLEALWQEGLQRFGGTLLSRGNFYGGGCVFCPRSLAIQTYGLNLSPDAQAYTRIPTAKLLRNSGKLKPYKKPVAMTNRNKIYQSLVPF